MVPLLLHVAVCIVAFACYRCPFLALSATIGNPKQVAGWLQDVKSLQRTQDEAKPQQSSKGQAALSYNVRLIQYSERYADLRYYRYTAPATQMQEGLAVLEHSLRRMHPFAVLEAQQIRHGGFPADLALEPADCLQLFNSMHFALEGQRAFKPEQASDQHQGDMPLPTTLVCQETATPWPVSGDNLSCEELKTADVPAESHGASHVSAKPPQSTGEMITVGVRLALPTAGDC